MARIKIKLPSHFQFSTSIPIRITDLNYGGHVGNDTVLSIIHEARVQFLRSHGYEELSIGNAALIMSDVAIEFKTELFYGDVLTVDITTDDFTSVAFAVYYKLQKKAGDNMILVAVAKTGMVCYCYENKKIVPLPDEVKSKLTAHAV